MEVDRIRGGGIAGKGLCAAHAAGFLVFAWIGYIDTL